MTQMTMPVFEESTQQIINGDCLEEMRKMADNSISAIVTDPPYGISFMGKGWDHVVPEMSYWEEALRISKPGAFLIAMGGARTFHRLTCAIEDAGWEIRDCISWLYGSGFPKSHNNFGIEGFGTALKPAWEPCIVAMKPLDGTFKQNAEKWGQAGINIDGCRIPTNEITGWGGNPSFGYASDGLSSQEKGGRPVKGRWPANVIFDAEAGRLLDEQTQDLHGAGKARDSIRQCEDKGMFGLPGDGHRIGDSGGASRFFYCAKASSRERNEGLEGLPLLSNMRVNGPRESEEDKTATKVRNNHPTVKPLKLMEYLIRLVMPPKDGLLLDPFAGSGTTILAAKRLGFNAIGIEKQKEYCDIANARLL